MNPVVLIIDDSLTVRMDLVDAFTAGAFRTLAACSAAEARALLAQNHVDIVILDVQLPDADGGDLLRELRSQKATEDLCIVMLSSRADVEDRIHGMRIGADEYVGKPYDIGYVVAKARELVRERRPGATGEVCVLLIDDSATFREELAIAVKGQGYAVLVAGSGEEGLRRAAQQRPDVIIVDGVLPGIDGATVIRHVRLDAALRGTPCLLLTGSGERNAEIKALDAGADAFAIKDADHSLVLAKLAAMLRRPARAVAVEHHASLLGPKRILAVDDSMTYLQELADSLRGEGYDVVSARSGTEAINLLAVQPADCILLDLVMPGLSGEETCRRIKAAPVVRDIPLIMLTSRDDAEAMIQGLKAGADDYISKASEFEILKARVRVQIRRKQFEDENRRIRDQLQLREVEAMEARAAHELAETRAVLVEQLSRKNRELETFTYAVSHDLRNPLRSIKGFTQLLLEGHLGAIDAEGRELFGMVVSSTNRMEQLIEDLLRLSRIDRVELRKVRTSLSLIARVVTDELARSSPGRVVACSIQEEVWAEVDAGLIRIALENLLGNAWKFTGRTPAPQVAFGCDAEGFFVRDNGAGFRMQVAHKLFRPFQRLHHEEDFSGTGIGLATVGRIIDRHGGKVWAEGEVGAGATFHFTVA